MRFSEIAKTATPLEIPRDKMPQVNAQDLQKSHRTKELTMPLSKLVPSQSERVPGLTAETVERIQSGGVKPIVIDRDNRIINGHHRYDAYQHLGYDSVDVIKVLDAGVLDLCAEYDHKTSDQFAEQQVNESKVDRVLEYFVKLYRRNSKDPQFQNKSRSHVLQRTLWQLSLLADIDYRRLEQELHRHIKDGKMPEELGFRKDLITNEDNVAENSTNGKEVAIHRSSERFSDIDLSKSADGTFWLSSPDTDWDNIVTTGRDVDHTYEISPSANLATWDDIDKYTVDQLEQMGYDGVRMVDEDETTYQIWNTDILSRIDLDEKKHKIQ